MTHLEVALPKLKSRLFGTLALCTIPALSVLEQVQTLGSSLVAYLLGYVDIKQKSKPSNLFFLSPLLIQTGLLYLRKERACLVAV